MGGILSNEKDDNPNKNNDEAGSAPDREQHIPSDKQSQQQQNIEPPQPPQQQIHNKSTNTNIIKRNINPSPNSKFNRNLTESPNINPNLVSLCAPIPNKKNKWNFQGDYHNNWEKNLIPINNKMQNDYHKSMITTKYWIRTIVQNELNPNIKFPEYINIIVAEFFVLPRCSSCGKYDNLWLNIGDGFIGCGKSMKFYALKSMGGNGCSLTHYNEYKNRNSNLDRDEDDVDNKESDGDGDIEDIEDIDDIDSNIDSNGDIEEDDGTLKPAPITVKLGTISAKGADVFDYDEQGMIFNADNDSDSDESDYEDEDEDGDGDAKKKKVTLMDLQLMLKHWGIEMNRMYLYDKTVHSNQSILDNAFMNDD